MPPPPAPSSPTRSPASIRANPETVLGLATGSTPLAGLRGAALAPRRASTSRGVRGFALDEYVGLDPRAPRELPLGDRARGGRAARPRPGAHPRARRIAARASSTPARTTSARSPRPGGVDLQLLGIGTDGHIGFNEPGSSFASLTRVKTLTEQTRAGQRAVLRLDRRRSAALHHAGARHDPACPAPGAARLRRGQGRGGRRRGRGAAHRIASGIGDPAASARDGRASTRPRHPTCASPSTTGTRSPTSRSGRACRSRRPADGVGTGR